MLINASLPVKARKCVNSHGKNRVGGKYLHKLQNFGKLAQERLEKGFLTLLVLLVQLLFTQSRLVKNINVEPVEPRTPQPILLEHNYNAHTRLIGVSWYSTGSAGISMTSSASGFKPESTSQ